MTTYTLFERESGKADRSFLKRIPFQVCALIGCLGIVIVIVTGIVIVIVIGKGGIRKRVL